MRIRLYINDCPIKDAEPANAEEMWEIIAQWKMDYKLTSEANYQVFQYVASKMTATEIIEEEPIEEDEPEEVEPETKERKYRSWDRPFMPNLAYDGRFYFDKPCPKAYTFYTPRNI